MSLSLSGCAVLEGERIDYKSAGQLPPLEAPPGMVIPPGDARFAVPDAGPRGTATLSAFEQARSGTAQPARQAVLPQVERVSVQRAGNQRWLSVELPAQEVWPVVREFWQGMGFIIALEAPEAGVMETDWAENRANIPQDALRGWLGRALGTLYSTAERDRFRTRLEVAADGKTEIYISHRGMFEVFEGTQGGGDQGQGRTVWQPRPADPELEAEMLRRLMVRFGVEETRARAQLAGQAVQPQASLVRGGDATPGVTLPEPFDRAWRRVGLALDRIGFAVEDRNRAAGVYYVRYADPEATARPQRGLLSRLAFWDGDGRKTPQAQRYQVRVQGAGGRTQVEVYLDDGTPARNDTGNRIATLLFEQLR